MEWVRGLRNYCRMREAELVALLQNNPPPGQSRASAAPTPAPGLLIQIGLHHLHRCLPPGHPRGVLHGNL